MIPFDHPTFPFPYNLVDRVEYTKENLIKLFQKNLNDVKKEKMEYSYKKEIKV